MLTVGVEGSPLDLVGALFGPFEGGCIVMVLDNEVAAYVLSAGSSRGRESRHTFVRTGQADDQRSKLVLATRSVDVGLEVTRRARVDLGGDQQL